MPLQLAGPSAHASPPPACVAPAQITSLSLGKAKAQRDRIFVAAGSHVSLLCGQGGIALGQGERGYPQRVLVDAVGSHMTT